MTTTHPTIPYALARALMYGDPSDWKWEDDFDEDALASFNRDWQLIESKALADPDESWYQGVNFMIVIRNRDTGELFGHPYWEQIAKYGEAFLEPDEEDSSVCAFRPVRPFTYPSYEIIPTQEITA